MVGSHMPGLRLVENVVGRLLRDNDFGAPQMEAGIIGAQGSPSQGVRMPGDFGAQMEEWHAWLICGGFHNSLHKSLKVRMVREYTVHLSVRRESGIMVQKRVAHAWWMVQS